MIITSRGCASHVEHTGESGNAYRVFIRKREGTLRKNGVGLVDWICLAQDRDHLRAIVNMVTILRIPYYCGKFLTSTAAVSFSRSTQFHAILAAIVQQSHASQQLPYSRQFSGYASGARKLLNETELPVN